MGNIFVSYSRGDEDRIAPLVSALKAHGWEVFWDQQLAAGAQWREGVARALHQANCIVVVWTRRSVKDFRVAEEADFARSRGLLLPVALDAVDLPIGFQGLQVADFHHWLPGNQTTSSEQFFRDVESLLKRRSVTEMTAPPLAASLRASEPLGAKDARSRLSRLPLAGTALGLSLVAVMGAWTYRASTDPVKTALRGLASPQKPERVVASHDLERYAQGSEATNSAAQTAPFALPKLDLSGLDLANANLARVVLRDANLQRVDLTEANLRGADLSGADLTEANLRGADLSGADLTEANLERADLRGARLTQSERTDPKRPCLLTRARMAGAKLAGADLSGTNLTNVVGLESAQLQEIQHNDATVLPNGSTLPR